jgi:Secretion system C-terminal sorting domain
MIKKFTTILAMAFASYAANAQMWVTDSVQMGAGRINDVYYHLGTGIVKTESNKNWFLALGTKGQTAGAFVNSPNSVVCLNPHRGIADWASISLADTATAADQLNMDTSWTVGALNRGANASDPFDFGFGTYNLTAHTVFGDSIFIIKQGNSFYKLAIDSVFGNNNWAIRLGGLSLPIPTVSYVFNKAPKYTNSNFIYINATSMGLADTTREPANNTWDVVITEYKRLVNNIPYTVVGILGNGKVSSAMVQGVNVDVVAASYNTAAYSNTINNIGSDWKFFNGSAYVYDSLQSYLVQSNDSNYYQIRFKDGAFVKANGFVRFDKRRVSAPMAISQINNNATSFGVYPNPAAADVMISLESKEATAAQIIITNIQGKTIFAKPITINQGLNAFSMPTAQIATGNYIISIKGKQISASQIFVKQ